MKEQSRLNRENHSYRSTLVEQARALLSGQKDRIANAANLSALVFMEFGDVSWAGFYFLQGDRLVLGPFQGKPACVTIPLGKGVCGTAAVTRTTQRVADVHAFPGHIACDVNAQSEVVVPLILHGVLIGVLDIDSATLERFGPQDQELIEQLAEIYLESIH
jgi:GAF domain-containing protein